MQKDARGFHGGIEDREMKLSVIIPCFNELNTIETVVNAVRNSPYENKEIIVVDDCSRAYQYPDP